MTAGSGAVRVQWAHGAGAEQPAFSIRQTRNEKKVEKKKKKKKGSREKLSMIKISIALHSARLALNIFQ